jgi:hypothetical protein
MDSKLPSPLRGAQERMFFNLERAVEDFQSRSGAARLREEDKATFGGLSSQQQDNADT